MKIKNIISVLLVVIILASCAPNLTIVPPTETSIPTSTFTVAPHPTATATVTPTVTPEPTPIGGGTLKMAFYGHDGKNQFLIVGDYFSGEIDYKIPVSHIWADTKIAWSPDGSFLLFEDIARLPTGDMKINLLNIKTGAVFNLSTHPAADSRRWNNLDLLKWSPDGQRVMYSPSFDEPVGFSKIYVASTDGTVQVVDGAYSDWLPDSRTIVDIWGDGTFYNNFDIIEQKQNTIAIPKLKGLKIDQLLRNYLILKTEGKDRLEGIPFPTDLNDSAQWQLDVLLEKKITLLTFSPEIKNPQFTIDFTRDAPNKKLVVIGRCSCSGGTFFGTLSDVEDLPIVVANNNLYSFTDEYFPILFSPDGQLVLLGKIMRDEHRNVAALPGYSVRPTYIRLKVISASGQEINVGDNLSQFNVEDTSVSNGGWGGSPYAGNTYLDGIDFYWQP